MDTRPKLVYAKGTHIYQGLNCSICMGLMWNPVMAKCGHSFCKKCIDEWWVSSKNCPTCRAKIAKNDLRLNRNMQDIVNEIQVICLHPGCDWAGPVALLETHGFECQFHPDRVPPKIAELLPSKEGYAEDEQEPEEAKVNGLAMMLNRVGCEKVSALVNYKPPIYEMDTPEIPDFLAVDSACKPYYHKESEEEFSLPSTVDIEIHENGKRRQPRRTCSSQRKYEYDERNLDSNETN